MLCDRGYPRVAGWREMKRRSVFRAVGMAVMLMALAAPVQAYALLGYEWSDSDPISTSNFSSGNDATAWSAARSAWNATFTPIHFTVASQPGDEDVAMSSVNRSNVEWDGFASWTTSGRYFTRVSVLLNKYFTDGYGPGKRKSVAVHELGHALGLADISGGARVMNGKTCGSSSRYCTYFVTTPQSDDIDGVLSIY